jgi:chromosome segregation ATPase
MELES